MGGAPTEPVSGTFNRSTRSQIEQLLDSLPKNREGAPVNPPGQPNVVGEFNAAALIEAGVPEGDLNTAIQSGRLSRASMLGLMADIGAAQPDVKATKHAEEVARRIAVAYGISDTKMINGLAKFESFMEADNPRAVGVKVALQNVTMTKEQVEMRVREAAARQTVSAAGGGRNPEPAASPPTPAPQQ